MKKLLFIAVSLSLIVNPYYVLADEISVTGNGEGSTNSVNVSEQQNTDVQQNNEAQVENNVDVNADTGNNETSGNLGETQIDTGNVETGVNVTNENINQSYVDAGCCNGDTDLKISGNGSGSNNQITYSSQNNTNVNINQTANITNQITGWANTGYNSANGNNGNVSINTGSIYVTENIENSDINVYGVSVKSGSGGSVSIKIDGNGTDSQNTVNFSNGNNIDININNSAKITNESNWELNTGKNEANGNNGNVKIATGDIYFQSTIKNGPVNFGWVDVDCCDQKKDGEEKPPDVTPPTPPANGADGKNGNGNGNGGAGGNGNGQDGDGLPVTGPSNLILLGLINIIMFFMGWYLRLRSGNSPPAFALR